MIVKSCYQIVHGRYVRGKVKDVSRRTDAARRQKHI
jgi:hypothetical protein